MPINLAESPLTTMKLGETQILKGYTGHQQVFPNDTEITAAAYDNATVTNAAQNTNYTVAGDIGSSFTLTGSTGATGLAGTQVLAAASTVYLIAIGDNTSCGAVARTPTITIAASGNTTLAGGLSTTDTISQAAGPITVNNTITGSITATNTVYNTVTVGSSLYWDIGAKWSITLTLSAFTSNVIGTALRATMQSYNTGTGTWDNWAAPVGVTLPTGATSSSGAESWNESGTRSTGTYSWDWELTAQAANQRFYMWVPAPDPNTSCYLSCPGGSSCSATIGEFTTATLFP
jgi:hypothetical protein